jgi:chorismate mutase
MPVRGIRGATVAAANTPEAIADATRELLLALAAANALEPADIASVIFSTTPDLTAAPPARAARALGWTDTALMCLGEMEAANGLPRCIRVLIHWNTDRPITEVRHVYLHAAAGLRPDRALQTNP